jgi:hypothetical protein
MISEDIKNVQKKEVAEILSDKNLNALIVNLKEIEATGNREDKLFYLSALKKIGQFGKRIYLLKPTEELKQNLIWLKKYLEDYKL